MDAVVLRAEELNLPETIAKKLKGRKVEIVEENERIIITPIDDSITKAFGMFEGGNLTTEKFLEQKRIDKAGVNVVYQ
jgi:virulence-associated protein VagC